MVASASTRDLILSPRSVRLLMETPRSSEGSSVLLEHRTTALDNRVMAEFETAAFPAEKDPLVLMDARAPPSSYDATRVGGSPSSSTLKDARARSITDAIGSNGKHAGAIIAAPAGELSAHASSVSVTSPAQACWTLGERARARVQDFQRSDTAP